MEDMDISDGEMDQTLAYHVFKGKPRTITAASRIMMGWNGPEDKNATDT